MICAILSGNKIADAWTRGWHKLGTLHCNIYSIIYTFACLFLQVATWLEGGASSDSFEERTFRRKDEVKVTRKAEVPRARRAETVDRNAREP